LIERFVTLARQARQELFFTLVDGCICGGCFACLDLDPTASLDVLPMSAAPPHAALRRQTLCNSHVLRHGGTKG
jgi:hypothetical protein